MGKINYGRVIFGGIVAGIIIDIFEYFLNGVYLNAQWLNVTQSINRPAIGVNQILWFNLVGLALGLLAVWTYAAIRPRYSPGVKTAVCAALLIWFVGYVLADGVLVIMTVIPMQMFYALVGVGLIEIVVATVVGAFLYKEASSP